MDRLAGENVPSPFSRLVATGFYDGPTSGYTECETCRSLYQFTMLEWDAGQDVRVFVLEEKRGTSFEAIVATIASKGEQPRWPVWVPHAPLPAEAEEKVAHLIANTSSARLIVAAENLVRTILVWRKLGPDDWTPEEGGWLQGLGLTPGIQ
jgi:hypothetical protein